MAPKASHKRETDDPEAKLSPRQQQELVKVCRQWIDFGHDIKREEFVGGLADALLERDSEKQIDGANFVDYIYPTWANIFLKKVTHLKRKLTEARNDAANIKKDDLAKQWQSYLNSLIDKYGIKKEDMQVAERQRQSPDPSEPNDERHPVASVIHCFSAKGTMLAPWAIGKGKADPYEKYAPIRLTCNENGFASRFNHMRWLTDHFDTQTRSSLKDGQWRLQLVDSYECPVKEDFFLWCREHRIFCVTLPRERREDLDPFYWRVWDRLEEEYKESLNLRGQQHLERTEHEVHSKKSSGIFLTPREFADILHKITIGGKKCEIAERNMEAAKAWEFVLSPSLGARVRESEDLEPWNKESIDEVFANMHEEDLGSQAVVTPKSSSREEAQLTPASLADSDDEYDPGDDHSNTNFRSKTRGRSLVANNSSTKSLVTRSKSTATKMLQFRPNLLIDVNLMGMRSLWHHALEVIPINQ
ncbi:hypothetical protein N7540_005723 [Penicillium herquei]|nr:hypothetical protein N7540_005723 [Penicillium herquei]